MKKKIMLTLIVSLFVVCLFSLSVSADSFSAGEYYLREDSMYFQGGMIYVYSSYEDFIADSDDSDGKLANYLFILYTSNFKDALEKDYNDYKENMKGDPAEGKYTNYTDYFEDYYGYSFNCERTMQDLSGWVEMMQQRENSENENGSESSGGNSDSGSSGGIEGDDGSSSTGGESSGKPNVTIDPNVDTSQYRPCFCYTEGILSTGATDCGCYLMGYADGWDALLNSDRLEEAINEAYGQGFQEVNTDSWHEMVANEREEAVSEYKTSEEYQSSLEEAKTQAIKDYRSSDKYVEDFNSEENTEEEQEKIDQIKNDIAEQAVEDFKNSPEQIEIIGQAKEGAKAEFVVEMDSVLKGDRQPATDYEEGMKVLVEEKIRTEREDAVNDFTGEMENIMSGESEPVEGSPGEAFANNIVQNIVSSFQKGLAQGEAQFKASLEYSQTLEAEYEAGADAGYQQGFMIGTNDGYSKGLLDGAELANEELYNKGKTEYMNTKAYKDTIQNTYDQGFADGSESKESNPLSYMIPIIVLCALVLVYFGISTNVKKKQKRK